MTIVSIQTVEEYSVEKIYYAICEHLKFLDVERELAPGLKVLLKPNMLIAKDPRRCRNDTSRILARPCNTTA